MLKSNAVWGLMAKKGKRHRKLVQKRFVLDYTGLITEPKYHFQRLQGFSRFKHFF